MPIRIAATAALVACTFLVACDDKSKSDVESRLKALEQQQADQTKSLEGIKSILEADRNDRLAAEKRSNELREKMHQPYVSPYSDEKKK
jgi:uncharacterized coiled-coil protein SlyX